MDWWSNNGSDDVIIGHLSHAYAPKVIEDRVIIIDEDPGDAFQTRFGAGDLPDLIRSFLTRLEDSPVENLDALKQIRNGGGAFKKAREELYEYASEIGYFELGKQILDEGQGHILAAKAVQALLEPEKEESKESDSWDAIRDRVESDFRDGHQYATDKDMVFVPKVFPGYDEVDGCERDGSGFIPRNQNGFQQLLELAEQYATSDRIDIATWNGWTEGHQIEPGTFRGEEYGTEYLEIIKNFQSG